MYQRLTKVDEKVNVGFASLKENAKPRRRHDRSTKNRKAKEKPACDPTHNSIDHLSVSSMARSASRSTQSSRRSESSSDTNRYASSYSPPPSSIAGSSPSTPLASEHSRHAGHHYQSVAANSLAPRHKTTASRHSRIDDTSKFPLPASASRMPFMPPPLFAPFFVPSPSEGRLKHMLERTVYREYM
ncbi:hypothetical protein JAAARDRAFT_426216 [Jaapia argillacea MUCL 33604]|uniref:Uncharacterized protein n=1 Tax=Jaapia argillacea MUCL 33604 TaxID=933084 RepID=A0A067PI49_9AGAM|nr:hypothetical protein JAAARDRAFT_426216 [Jaapia argillacea MUCL 33604]